MHESIDSQDPQTQVAAEPPELKRFLNTDYGVIGRTVSTTFEPNTSSKFHFWLSEQRATSDSESTPEEPTTSIASLEIGNIVAACSDDHDDVTFGLVIEMRSYSDVESFIADFLSHNFGDANIEVPTDISQVIVVTCSVMRIRTR